MNEMAPPSKRAEGAEGTGGGAVSVLSSPPPPSNYSYSDNHPVSKAEILLALDEVLDRQETHAKALRTLQTGFVVAVCVLGAAIAVVAVKAFQ